MDKRNEPLKIAVNAPLRFGGVSALMISIQNGLDRDKLNFDYFVVHNRKEPQEDTVVQMGSRKLVASADEISWKPLRAFVRLFRVRSTFRKSGIQILHFNGASGNAFFTLLAARLGGVKYITFHSHNGGQIEQNCAVRLIDAICKQLLPLVVDDFWTCSEIAAKFAFPKRIWKQHRYYFMPNAIDVEKFSYAPEIRRNLREQLNLDGKYVIGHVGRFSPQKNHGFLLDLFQVLVQKDSDAVLLLFGSGELMQDVEDRVRMLGLSERVRIMGNSDKMHEMYQAMDVFVMPSLFEGLPVSGIEAQASGLPVIFSDTITREVAVTDSVEYIPLCAPLDVWAERILAYRNAERASQTERLIEAGFERKQMIHNFQEYYLSVGQKLRKY